MNDEMGQGVERENVLFIEAVGCSDFVVSVGL